MKFHQIIRFVDIFRGHVVDQIEESLTKLRPVFGIHVFPFQDFLNLVQGSGRAIVPIPDKYFAGFDNKLGNIT